MNEFQYYRGFETSTALFRELYGQVTQALREFQYGLADVNEHAWFDRLISGFDSRFEAWRTDLSLHGYLRSLDRVATHRNGPLLRLIGHAYLHIGLDLPRVVADSIDNTTISPERARDLFYCLNPRFRETFVQISQDARFSGRRALVARLLSSRRATASLHNLLGDRIILWRCHAYANGEFLSDSAKRPTREEMLRRSFDEITSGVLHSSKDPIQWLDGLKPPWIVIDTFEGSLGTRLQTRPAPGPRP